MRLKVLSWNIWIYGYFDQIKDFLKNADADIIGLQEMQADDLERDIIPFLTELGYNHAFAPVPKTGKRNVNDGPGIFTKLDILSSEQYVLSKENSRCAVRADVRVGSETLHVFSVHLLHTHQEYWDVQKEQADNLMQLLPNEKTVVMGDFNATPDSEIIQKMRATFKDSDPSEAPTWNVHPVGEDAVCDPKLPNIRLDYIFTTPDIKVYVPRTGGSEGSDHLPISVEVEL